MLECFGYTILRIVFGVWEWAILQYTSVLRCSWLLLVFVPFLFSGCMPNITGPHQRRKNHKAKFIIRIQEWDLIDNFLHNWVLVCPSTHNYYIHVPTVGIRWTTEDSIHSTRWDSDRGMSCAHMQWLVSSLLALVCVCVKIGRARYRAPEVLFHPHLIGDESEGVHEVSTTIPLLCNNVP